MGTKLNDDWINLLKAMPLDGLLDILKYAKESSDIDMMEADFIKEEIKRRVHG